MGGQLGILASSMGDVPAIRGMEMGLSATCSQPRALGATAGADARVQLFSHQVVACRHQSLRCKTHERQYKVEAAWRLTLQMGLTRDVWHPWHSILAVQADDGYLYPLEKAFFYVHKPPMLITHEEIDGVEFMRQGGGVLAASAKTFDLNIRVQSGTVSSPAPIRPGRNQSCS